MRLTVLARRASIAKLKEARRTYLLMADDLTGKKILLVDDDAEVLKALQAALGETGAEIDTASDGDTAVNKAISDQPDVIVLDLMLPKRSGLLVLEKLRKGKQQGEPPHVIMITGNMGQRHRVFAESMGAAAYMTKPFRMERLVNAVKELIG